MQRAADSKGAFAGRALVLVHQHTVWSACIMGFEDVEDKQSEKQEEGKEDKEGLACGRWPNQAVLASVFGSLGGVPLFRA